MNRPRRRSTDHSRPVLGSVALALIVGMALALALLALPKRGEAATRADKCDLAAITQVQAQHAHNAGDSQKRAVARVLTHLDGIPIAYGHRDALRAYVKAVVGGVYSRPAHPIGDPHAAYGAAYEACMQTATAMKVHATNRSTYRPEGPHHEPEHLPQ